MDLGKDQKQLFLNASSRITNRKNASSRNHRGLNKFKE